MKRCFKTWLKDDGATAAIEAGFLFPLLMMILCGTLDTGVALVLNQKIINASHTICDLLTRASSVKNTDVDDAIIAGQLAMKPYSTSTMGVDVAAIKFINPVKTPTVQWRRTTGMSENLTMITNSAGLGDENEGVLGVTVTYTYHPLFTAYFSSPVPMTVVSYGRSRKSSSGLVTCSTGGATCS